MEKFPKSAYYSVKISSPFDGQWDNSIRNSIHNQDYKIRIEYDISKFECIRLDSDNNECLNKNETFVETNLEKPWRNKTLNFGTRYVKFTRNFESMYEVLKWKSKRFTGFTVKWNCTNCTGETSIYNTFSQDKKNIYFVRMANLVDKGPQPEKILNALKTTKMELNENLLELFLDGSFDWKRKMFLKTNMFDLFFEKMEAKLNISKEYEDSLYDIDDEVSDQSLAEAADMYIYMTASFQKYWLGPYKLFSAWLEKLSRRRILGF